MNHSITQTDDTSTNDDDRRRGGLLWSDEKRLTQSIEGSQTKHLHKNKLQVSWISCSYKLNSPLDLPSVIMTASSLLGQQIKFCVITTVYRETHLNSNRHISYHIFLRRINANMII
jgi:hypothetical protein